MWQIIPRALFVRAPVLPCYVQRQSPDLATTAVALAHGKNILRLNAVDGLVQPLRQAGIHAVRRDM